MRLDLALRLNSLGTWRRGGGVTPAFATGTLSFNGNASDGETATIGTTVYRFVNALALAYDVLIGASASITILNLIAAVNAGAGEGTVYGTGTLQHPGVTASAAPGVMNVTANTSGVAGNSIVTTSTSVTATWGAATLQGGAGPAVFNSISPFAGGAQGALMEPFDLSTLFQDSAGTTPVTTDGQPVGRMADKSGNGNHLLQATALLRPIYRTDGTRHWIESDGTQWMRSLFTITQPWERISALREITWSINDQIFGGGSANAGVIFQSLATPNIQMFSGTNLDIANPAIGADFVVTERHNGVSSRGAINTDAYVTGNAGATAPGGFTLFANNSGAGISNARCYGVTMREGLMTDAQIADVRAFVAAKAGIFF